MAPFKAFQLSPASQKCIEPVTYFRHKICHCLCSSTKLTNRWTFRRVTLLYSATLHTADAPTTCKQVKLHMRPAFRIPSAKPHVSVPCGLAGTATGLFSVVQIEPAWHSPVAMEDASRRIRVFDQKQLYELSAERSGVVRFYRAM